MNKDEMKMIEKMAKTIGDCGMSDCVFCNGKQKCLYYKSAETLYNANYRKVADDEIVIKKSEYEKLSKDYATINNSAYYCGVKVGGYQTAREILQELYDEANSYVCKIVELTTFQIEQLAKEKGIELEG